MLTHSALRQGMDHEVSGDESSSKGPNNRDKWAGYNLKKSGLRGEQMLVWIRSPLGRTRGEAAYGELWCLMV